MHDDKIESLSVPTEYLVATKVSGARPQRGLLFSHRKAHPPILVTVWDGASYAMYLEGDHAFKFFELKLDITVRGLLVPEVHALVDIASHYDPRSDLDPMGALVINDKGVWVAGSSMGDGFGDTVLVPTGLNCGVSAPDESVGFNSWALAITRDGKSQILWKSQKS